MANFLGTNGDDLLLGSEEEDLMDGGPGHDRLLGRGEDDLLSGGDGNDQLWGGPGGDALQGGAGLDYARYDESVYPGMTVAMFAPHLNTGPAAGDTYTGIEGLILGAGNDTGHGDHSSNYVYGIGGNDNLYGQGADDFIVGGEGHDQLWGGLGADILDGGEGFDYARYDDAGFPGMTVALFAPGLNTGAAAGDVYGSIEGLVLGYHDDTGHGSHAADHLYGINGNDRLYGQGGDDHVFGGDGHDQLWGGLGADALHGGDGFDYARYDDAGFPGMTVSLAFPGSNTGAAAGDSFSGIEGLILGYADDTGFGGASGDYLYGINGDDDLFGNGGDDFLHGGPGNDLVLGGLGNDTLVGDTGRDQFYFTLGSPVGIDVVLDFQAGVDILAMDGVHFVSLQASMFRSGAGVTTAADADDFVLYDTSTGNLYYDADGAGGTAARHFATLANQAALQVSDFFIGT